MIIRTYQSEVRRRHAAIPVASPAKPARDQRRWTDHDIAALDRMIAEGLTFGQMARKLDRTRNSVIGFDWRRRRV